MWTIRLEEVDLPLLPAFGSPRPPARELVRALKLHSLGRALDLPIPPHTWEAERLLDLKRRVSEALGA